MSTVVTGIVVGRMCMEQISVQTEHGKTIRVRVRPELGVQLDLGVRAEVVLGQTGRPEAIRPAAEQPQGSAERRVAYQTR